MNHLTPLPANRTILDIDGVPPLQRRYGPKSSKEWQLVRRHLELEGGMAFITVLVPEPAAAEICRDELAGWLAPEGKRLAILPLNEPATLATLSFLLATFPITPDLGALWICAGMVSEADPEYPAWRRAWWEAASRVNERRDIYRRRFSVPLLFVGPPWLQPLFRDAAPDFWSTRAFVVRIAREAGLAVPDRMVERESRRESTPDQVPRPAPEDSPDPEFALQEAAKLAGRPERILLQAELYLRAGRGFYARNDLVRTEESFRQALALQEQGGDTPTSRGITMGELGRAVMDQGRLAEAESLFRQALALQEQGGDTPTSRGITTHGLGRAVMAQGRLAEAETLFRQALAQKEQGGDTPTSRGITMGELGRAVRDQGRLAEAESLFRQALALGEQGGDTPTSRGITMSLLGRVVLDQGRYAEAEALLRQALVRKREGGDTAASIRITLEHLAQALTKQGRAEQAASVLAEAESLKSSAA